MAKRWRKEQRRRFADRAFTEGVDRIAGEAQVKSDTVMRWMNDFGTQGRLSGTQQQSSAMDLSAAQAVAGSGQATALLDSWEQDRETLQAVENLAYEAAAHMDYEIRNPHPLTAPVDSDLIANKTLHQAILNAGDASNENSPYWKHLQSQVSQWADKTIEQGYEFDPSDFPPAPDDVDEVNWEFEVLERARKLLANRRMQQVTGWAAAPPVTMRPLDEFATDAERAAVMFAESAISVEDMYLESDMNDVNEGSQDALDTDMWSAQTLYAAIRQAGDADDPESPYMEQLGDNISSLADNVMQEFWYVSSEDGIIPEKPDTMEHVEQDEWDAHLYNGTTDELENRIWNRVKSTTG